MSYNYYELQIKLLRPMLGTCTATSIYAEHVLEKAKKEIKKVNSLLKKVAKSMEKYVGSDISEHKEIQELKGIMRTFQELTGEKEELPDSLKDILDMAKSLEERWNEMATNSESRKATVFMRSKDGQPMISSHMILGNIKENVKIAVNNGDKLLNSKKAVSETLALDVKPVEEFLIASKDIYRAVQKPDGTFVLPEDACKERDVIVEDGRILCERPIKFDRMGKIETAIASSEQLPKGTEFKTVLRIRAGSPFDSIDFLKKIFDLGKNDGLGAWRGSGNYGSYVYKLQALPEYKEDFEGWE